MGKDARWLSDIAGSALLGIGTTKLLLYLHREHEANSSRYRVFPMLSHGGVALFVSYTWGGPWEQKRGLRRPQAADPQRRSGKGTSR
jgi:hypothetical protein